MKYLSLATIIAAASVVKAQIPSSIPACAIDCAAPVCSGGVADLACICLPTNIAAIGSCVFTACTATSDLAVATALASICPTSSGGPTSPVETVTSPTLTATVVVNGTTNGTATRVVPSITVTTSNKPAGTAASTVSASGTAASSSGNVVFNNGGLAGVLALAVALAVAVGVVA